MGGLMILVRLFIRRHFGRSSMESLGPPARRLTCPTRPPVNGDVRPCRWFFVPTRSGRMTTIPRTFMRPWPVR